MLIDGASAADIPRDASMIERAVASFLRFIENRLNVSVIRNNRALPLDPALREAIRFGAFLREKGVIKEFGRTRSLPDEPRIHGWYAICNHPNDHRAGGTTWERSADALYAALAEGLERYLWYSATDYFIHPTPATAIEIARKGRYIAPEMITGYGKTQRSHARRVLRTDASYLWVQGTSLVRSDNVYLPAQVVSGVWGAKGWARTEEPEIRAATTNGLATSKTQRGARLRGALELIEREAYMMMWLNQLTLPRLSLRELCAGNAEIRRCIAACERYRLRVHVLELPTDAPTHAVAAVVEDLTDTPPRFTLGLNAHRSLSYAVPKAVTEALRARHFHRRWVSEGNSWDPSAKITDIGHRDRVYYWGVPENARRLEFLTQGAEKPLVAQSWEKDSEEEHLERIVRWCAEKNVECVSVSLGRSKENPTPLHIEMVVMPELQPTYLSEATRAFGGTRWQDVPRSLGYRVLPEPFAATPHPFL
jgi:ribosomal protein S12 methylthiotransferase accessory factor